MSEIKRAESIHIPQMVLLLKELFSIEVDFEFDAQKHTKGLSQLINKQDALVLVACEGRDVIAMCSMQCVISSATGEKSGWVEDVVVDQRHRGKGLGTLLLEQMERQAKKMGVTRLQLLVDTQNRPALHFYQKQCWSQMQLNAMRKVLV